jgi:hypothetical protein
MRLESFFDWAIPSLMLAIEFRNYERKVKTYYKTGYSKDTEK